MRDVDKLRQRLVDRQTIIDQAMDSCAVILDFMIKRLIGGDLGGGHEL